MSVETSTEHDPVREQLETSPEFRLECLFDDVDDPSQVTVFPTQTERTATEWLTIDRGTAVPLDEVR